MAAERLDLLAGRHVRNDDERVAARAHDARRVELEVEDGPVVRLGPLEDVARLEPPDDDVAVAQARDQLERAVPERDGEQRREAARRRGGGRT